MIEVTNMQDNHSQMDSGIKITAVDTFLVKGNCCFVKIRTNNRDHGAG
jgi:hypothetical protein